MASTNNSPRDASDRSHDHVGTVRLLSETTRSEAFVLDAMTCGRNGMGQPITFIVARLDTAWFDRAVERLLRRWAATSELVHINVRKGIRAPIMEVRCDSRRASVFLELLEVA